VEREDIVTLENILSASGGREENILTQKLGQLNSCLSAARTESIGLATRHQQITEASRNADLLQSVPDVVNNPIVQSVKRELIALKREYLERLEKYGEKHPRMNALRKEIASVQSRLEVEVARVAKSVKMQYEMALANEKSLEEALEKAKSEVMELNKKAIHYGMVKQEVESNREMYEMIMKRAKETSLTSALKSTNVHIVDRAKVPRSPVRPQVRKNTLMAAAIALMLGAGLALLLEYMDHTFHGPDEVRRYLGVPYLGSVGLAPRIKRAKASELIALEDPRANAVETVRTVRTNVLFSFTNAGPKALVITSPGPLEGKTFITANLALTLAQMGRRVLLVDGDLRKPRLHKIFGKRSKPGLSDLISGNCTLCEAAKDTQVKDLKFLPSGKAPPNPSEILGCNRMQDFVAQCMASFDFVLFDTPPVLSVTDASALAGSIDGTVVVLKAGETKRGNARRALEQLKAIDSNVLGVVLNQVDFKKNRYYYNYDTSYYYGHYGHYGGNGRKRGQRSREVDRTSDDISDADYSPPAQLEI
jgi:capsular exopolysaccharide synthesis family protein